MNLRTCSMVFVATIACGHVSAGVISLDLLDPAGVGGTAGEAFEARNPFTISDVTFSAAAVTSLGSMTGAYSANASTAGLNSVGVLDSPSEMDVGEVLTFTLTFDDAALAVKLLSIDFSGIGSTSDDSALATTSAGMFTLFTSQPTFDQRTALRFYSPLHPWSKNVQSEKQPRMKRMSYRNELFHGRCGGHASHFGAEN